MKKIFSLFAAVLMAGSMMAGSKIIKFEAAQAVDEVAGTTYGSEGFTLAIPATSDKAVVDAANCTFGISTEETVSFTHRLKTGGASNKSARVFTLNVPEDGTLIIYARTSSNTATDRNFVISNEMETIVNHICLETDTVLGATPKVFLPVVVDNVSAGAYSLTYPVNGINFYGFKLVTESGAPTPDPVNVGVTFSENGYTNGQDITKVDLDEVVSISFNKGTNSNGPKYYTSGSAIRCYGSNTFTVSANNAKLTNIALTFGTGDGANEITANVGTYADGTWTGEAAEVIFTIGGTTGNRRLAGMTVTYVENEIPAVGKPVFSIAAGSFYDAQTLELTCATEGASIYYTLDGTEPGASATLYTSAITISETTTVKAVAVKGAARSEVLTREYVIATQYASLAELISEAGAPASQKVVVTLTNEVVDSFYVSGGTNRNGVYLTVGDRAVEIYCVNVPAEWEVGGTISGVLKGEWKEWYGTWEVCPSSWEGITYTAPLTFEVAKTAETITITPSDLEAPYYVAVLDPSLPAAWAFYNDSAKLALYANVIAEIGSQAALAAASVTGVQTITLADYTTEGFYQVVAGAMHYDATAEGNINGFVIDSEVASETFTVETPVVLDPATWYGTASFTTGGAVINPAVTANVDYEITRNADKTLTISCTIDAEVVGLVPQVNLAGFHNLVNVDGVWTYTTTETYTDGDEITIELYMAYAGAASSIPVVYTVGSANTKPVTFTFAAGENGVVTVTPSIEEVNYAYVFCNQAILDTYAELGIATERDFLEAMIGEVEDISDIVAFGEDEVDIHDFASVMSNTLDYQLTTGTYTLLVIALNVEVDEDDDLVITPVGEMARFEGVSYNATTTAIDNVEAAKTVKTIENGQVVIIRDGIRYNAVGAKL